jgi:hypothetical protein
MVDFTKLRSHKDSLKNANPIEIFKDLDKKVGKEYLRPAQEYVLDHWYKKFQDQKDTIIKLPTGHGKTLIGLLILQSSLKEGKGPAVYLCPNTYLVNQTVEQAKFFGIKSVTSGQGVELPNEFLNSEAILITTCNKMFTGYSKFGVSGSGKSEIISIGSLVMDDAHKCLDIIHDAFSIKVNVDTEVYKELFLLFKDALKMQESGTYDEICYKYPLSQLAVPYWKWYDQEDAIINIIRRNIDSNEIRFPWNLIKNQVKNCLCIFSGKKCEIIPRVIPIDLIPSFSECKRRIFLSATLTDDAFLIKDLRISSKSILNPIFFDKEKYSGERLILIPSLVDVSLTRESIINWLKEFTKRNGNFGVVTLVPSFTHADAWRPCLVPNVSEIQKEIENLNIKIQKRTAKEVLVLTNQYDGIDLPDDTCRILCLDSLPSYISLSDQYYQYCRSESNITRRMMAQKIEQGIGRSIRGTSDYSVVIIIGNNLINFLAQKNKRVDFSNEANEQIKIGEEVARAMKSEEYNKDPINTIEKGITQVLDRNPDWKVFYRDEMSEVTIKAIDQDYVKHFKREFEAELAFQRGNYPEAIEIAQKLVDEATNEKEKGWYLQLKGIYQYPLNPSEQIKIQLKAFEKNCHLFRPELGASFKRLISTDKSRSQKIFEDISLFEGQAVFNVHLSEILNKFDFEQSSKIFEEGVDNIGQLLGFDTQRPEQITGAGPDNLWYIGNKTYWIIECKNEVLEERGLAKISKKESNQLNSSIAWFKENYPDCTGIPVFMHPHSELNFDAFMSEPFHVMQPVRVSELKINLSKFYNSIMAQNKKDISVELINKNLMEFKLDITSLNQISLKDVKPNIF